MCFSNNPTCFSTDPGKGKDSSRYYVFKNGTIRAKFADKPDRIIHVRPGKNICYIPDKSSADESDKANSMMLDGKYVTYADAMDAKGKYQKPGAGMAPVDFFLDDKGEYKGSFHRGHGISDKFSARIGDKAVNLDRFDEYILATYSDGAGKLRDGVKEGDASLDGYLKWLSGRA